MANAPHDRPRFSISQKHKSNQRKTFYTDPGGRLLSGGKFYIWRVFFSVSLYQSPQVGHHMGANPWTLSRPLPSSYLFTLVTVNPTTRWRWQFILPASAYLARLSGGAIGSSLGELWGCSTPKTYTKINGFYYANTSSRKVIRSGYGLEICWVTEIGSPWVNFYRQCRQWRVLYCSILRLIAVLSPSPYLFLSFMTGILG